MQRNRVVFKCENEARNNGQRQEGAVTLITSLVQLKMYICSVALKSNVNASKLKKILVAYDNKKQ